MYAAVVNESPSASVNGATLTTSHVSLSSRIVTRLVICVFALLPLVVDGCGGEASRDSGAGETAPQPRAAPETITEADSGESFMLRAVSETRLRLSGKYDWNEPTVRGQALELIRVDYFQDPGFSEWMLRAVRPGTATITARGTSACAGQEPCPAAPLRFRIEITVAP
jgi:predicted secreted protein